jgi:DNA-binding transcriptional ArsR family regulator
VKHVIISSVGENIDAIYTSVREFPTKQLILISPETEKSMAEKIRKELGRFRIPIKVYEIRGDIWEETFKTILTIRKIYDEQRLLINVSVGKDIPRLALTSAAFINGIKAFTSDEDRVVFLPVLKFSYYRMITDKKKDILRILYSSRRPMALEELSKKTRMSLPLISYHINGTLKSEGLKKLGLIETREQKGKLRVRLTTQGRLLIKGYIA